MARDLRSSGAGLDAAMTGTCPERKAILVVDDDEVFLRSLLDGLAVYAGEFEVVGAHDGEAALAALAEARFDLLLTDLRMPGVDGFELLRRLAQTNRRVPLIVMTALGAREIGDRLDAAAPLSLLDKPLDFEQLLGAIRAALEPDAPVPPRSQAGPDRGCEESDSPADEAPTRQPARERRADVGDASASRREPSEDSDGAA